MEKTYSKGSNLVRVWAWEKLTYGILWEAFFEAELLFEELFITLMLTPASGISICRVLRMFQMYF
jgi:hypothetical protein